MGRSSAWTVQGDLSGHLIVQLGGPQTGELRRSLYGAHGVDASPTPSAGSGSAIRWMAAISWSLKEKIPVRVQPLELFGL